MSTQYFEHDGGRIAFDDTGDGPLVVCVPGMGDVRAEYRFLTPQLVSAGYRVVTMDVRGHGETSVGWSDVSVAAIGSDILALIRRLNAGPAIIVGTSMAAGAAVCVAAKAPQAVTGLVLIGPFVRDTMPGWQRAAMFGTMFRRPWGVSVWSRYFATLFPTARPADWETYTAAQKNNLREKGRLDALRGMMLASKQASEAALSKVNAPTLVIMGTKDPDFNEPAAEARLVAERLDGRVQMIDGAGHYPHAEMPAPTASAILGFLGRLQEAERHVA
ncbi:MAG: alpha/beta hydrolase [Anaerolineae bacterium]